MLEYVTHGLIIVGGLVLVAVLLKVYDHYMGVDDDHLSE